MKVRLTRRELKPLFASIAVAGANAAAAMAEGLLPSSNVRLFNAIIDRGFNRGDVSVADDICAAKLTEHEYLSKTDVPGPEILKDQIQTARRNINGFALTIEDL